MVPNHTDHEPVLSRSLPNTWRVTSIRVVLKTNVSDGGGFQTAPLLISQLFFTWQETSLSCHFLITSHTSHSAEAPPTSHLPTFSSHKNASLFFLNLSRINIYVCFKNKIVECRPLFGFKFNAKSNIVLWLKCVEIKMFEKSDGWLTVTQWPHLSGAS